MTVDEMIDECLQEIEDHALLASDGQRVLFAKETARHFIKTRLLCHFQLKCVVKGMFSEEPDN